MGKEFIFRRDERDNCNCYMEEVESGGTYALVQDNAALRAQVEELKRKNAAMKRAIIAADAGRHLDAEEQHDRATRAEAERDEVKDDLASANVLYLSTAKDLDAALLERDAEKARVEKLERVRDAALRYCRAEGHRDTHNADAYLRATLAECEEGK